MADPGGGAWEKRTFSSMGGRAQGTPSHHQLEGVHRTLTPRSTAVIRSHTIVTRARCWSLDLDPGSGTRISAKQQSHTEEYGVVHGGSNHIRKNTKEYGVLHEERIIRSS